MVHQECCMESGSKRILAVGIMALALTAELCCLRVPADTTKVLEGNLLKITTVSDYEAGSLSGLMIDSEAGDGALVLEDDRLEGSFESAVCETDSYAQMNACWSASVFSGSEVEVYAKARIDGEWTEYLTWGPYTPFKDRGTKEGKTDERAFVDQDTFCMEEGLEADAVQMKVVLRRSSLTKESPIVQMISMTFRGGEMKPAYDLEKTEQIPDRVLIEAPAYSQSIRDPYISHDICSPTVMTVMINSRAPELGILPDEFAINVRDEGEEIFGSWSFCVAGAGLYGFEAYTLFGGLDCILQELAQGRTVGINVRYTNLKDTDAPYLDGVFDRTSSGHLICLIGYEYEYGIRDEDHLYFFSSDSYGERDQTCYRRYKWSQLKDCFQGMVYIIPENERLLSGDRAPGVLRVEAELVKDPERDDTWILRTDEGDVDMERFVTGAGILALSVSPVPEAAPHSTDHSICYEKPMFTEANQPFSYDVILRRDGSLVLNRKRALNSLGVEDNGQELLIYAISDRGVCFKAVLPE